MSLVIYLSEKKVIISKFQLEFPFSRPPENLTQAALGAYKLLRQSETIQSNATRNEKEEVMTLLRQYGFALYQSIFPSEVRSRIYKSGGLFLFSLDEEIMTLPWELLHDGTSFFALTQGVIRINNSTGKLPSDQKGKARSDLNISLNAYSPPPTIQNGNRFIAYVEELTSAGIETSPRVEYFINGNASKDSIVDSLKANPDIFLFSGHDRGNGWVLDNLSEISEINQWIEKDFKPTLSEAVKNGLQIVLLQTSSLLTDQPHNGGSPLHSLFDLGVPYIISICGRIARDRIKEYLRIFLANLLREENILKAHRHAINALQSSVPLSWDWSWIQLRVNKSLLENTSKAALPPFQFQQPSRDDQRSVTSIRDHIFLSHRFSGNFDTLSIITRALLDFSREDIVCLSSSDGSFVEEYVTEFFRRQSPYLDLSLSLLYYQRWGFQKSQRERLPEAKFSNLFSFLSSEKSQYAYFDQSLIEVSPPGNPTRFQRYLIVYHPPERRDPSFDKWLQTKIVSNWKVIVITNGQFLTSLPTKTIVTETVELSDIVNLFEDELPEEWIEILSDRLPPGMTNMTILSIIQRINDQQLINAVTTASDTTSLWEKTFETVLPLLSSDRQKILITLYLLKVKCSLDYLSDLLSIKKIESELDHLCRLRLIHKDLSSSHAWMPVNIQFQIGKYRLIPDRQLIETGREITQHQIRLIQGVAPLSQYKISGFQYCANEMVTLGSVENTLQRYLQFGKKASRGMTPFPFRLSQTIRTSLELAIVTEKGKIIQKVLYSLIQILENLPFIDQTINLCEWILRTEERRRDWSLVSETQMRLASIYAKSGRKEKAIGLVTSAIQLNNDIKNYANRSQNLITIALLLLDLDEFERLEKLVGSANFDIKLLNQNDILKLWLIDGHLLFHNNRLEDAKKSFLKLVDTAPHSISKSLEAKTSLKLAKIFHQQNLMAEYQIHLKRAADLFEESLETDQASELHEILGELSLSSGDTINAIHHLEWQFNYYTHVNRPKRARSIADKLGGLHFKAGNHEKSTDYYSIAQGI